MLTRQLAGFPVVYLEVGEGPPIVIVHGINSFAHDWSPVAQALASRGFRVLVPYRRGRAPSGPQGAGYSLHDEVRDTAALLDLAGPDAALVGHSYGGLVALLTAPERPELRVLVLYEPPVPTAMTGTTPALEKIGAALSHGDRELAVATLITEVDGDPPERVAEVRQGPHWASLVELADTMYGELSAINTLANAGGVDLESYRDVRVPTTVLVGERTEPVFGTGLRAIVGALPRAKLVTLPGQGHLAHVQAPAELAEVIDLAVR